MGNFLYVIINVTTSLKRYSYIALFVFSLPFFAKKFEYYSLIKIFPYIM